MKQKIPKLFQAYQDGLRRYLVAPPDGNLEEAHTLGEQALGHRLETLDFAKMHLEALVILILDPPSVGNYSYVISSSGKFFAAAVLPIEGSHKAAKDASIKLKSTFDKLNQRTAELAESNKALKAEFKSRKRVESSLRVSESTTSELLAESLLLQEELRFLSRRLLVAQEEERKRISRELHDVVAQTLTGINVRLATLTLQTDINSEGIQRKIASTQRLVEKSVDIVHRFARDLRPTVLDDLGLIPALQSYLQDFMERSGIRAALTVFAGVEELGSTERTVLYRVAQEALINVSHHSKATNASVSIRKMKRLIRMEIHDDGIGFDVDSPLRSQSCQRLGLLGMRERVEMIGGRFRVISKPGKQTTVRVDIPLALAEICTTSVAEKQTSTPK